MDQRQLDGGGLLNPLDDLRLADANATRAGIVDRVTIPGVGDDDREELGFCHIAMFLALTILYEERNERMLVGPWKIATGGIAAVQLAMDMLNTGDGSVVPEIEGLNETCKIRFTGEVFDTGVRPAVTLKQVTAVLDRKTHDEREVCGFMGAFRSAVSIPMSILTGLEKRPQLSPFSTSSQLDDKQTFSHFGRLITSETGLAVPFILYLKEHNVCHLGVVAWNDEYGNAYIRALLEQAANLHPELIIVSVDIPTGDTSDEDYANAVEVLANTGFRWFFALYGYGDHVAIMEEGVKQGIVGTGEHVWILNSASSSSLITGQVLEKDSPLAVATQGLGMFSTQGGRPGMPVYDKFVERWQALDNEQDLAFIQSRLPDHSDNPVGFTGIPTDSTLFEANPASLATVMFDETIMFGLSACAAAAQGDDGITVDGDVMYDAILSTSFQGATGRVALDPDTGSRLPTTALFRITNVVEEPINATHVTFRVQESDAFMNGKWVQQQPYVYNDGTTEVPPDLPELPVDYNHIGMALRVTGLVMAALVLLASISLACWTLYQRKARVVQASQPIFLLILCAGTFIMGSTIIPLSIDDEIASEDGCTIACMTVPWLSSVGFALIFAALFSKTWRVNLLFRQGFRRMKLTALDVMKPLFGLLAVNVIVLTIWTIMSPLEWEREDIGFDAHGRPDESRGFCSSDEFVPFVLILTVVDTGALMLASYQAYQARNVATEFAESEYITKAIACMFLMSFVGIPTMIIVSDEPRAMYFVLTGIVFVLCTAVLLFIFLPKIRLAGQDEKQKGLRNIKSAIRESARMQNKGKVEATIESLDSLSQGIGILNVPEDICQMRSELARLRERNEELEGLLARTDTEKMDDSQ